VRTECGLLSVANGEIVVIQRGHRFSVQVNGPSRGYICEVFNGHFRLPDLGPIGANGLASPRDFKSPVAAFEDRKCAFTVVHKFAGDLWSMAYDASVFDVVAWHGNYVPYKYNLADFVPAGAISREHMDPSIFTVLTCPTLEPGVACVDFVIFPPRWAVQEGTFRPPYYHRNTMTEFMGNLKGKYEAKPEGFQPGGGSLHSIMSGHGPDAQTYKKASVGDLRPTRLPDDSLAYMFESCYFMRLTEWALNAPTDTNYHQCWAGLEREFSQSPAAAAVAAVNGASSSR